MIKNDLQKHNQTSFKARKIAVSKPVIDGIAKEIEVFTLSQNDKDTFCKIAQKVNLNELLPSKVNATNFPIWQKLIEVTGDCIGHFKHQKIFLAVQDRKPCGVLLATANKNQAEELNYYCIKKPLSPFKLSSKIDMKNA